MKFGIGDVRRDFAARELLMVSGQNDSAHKTALMQTSFFELHMCIAS